MPLLLKMVIVKSINHLKNLDRHKNQKLRERWNTETPSDDDEEKRKFFKEASKGCKKITDF